jgi:hypothetical protein
MIIPETKQTHAVYMGGGRAGFTVAVFGSDIGGIAALLIVRWPWAGAVSFNCNGQVIRKGRIAAFDWRDNPMEPAGTE